MALIVAVLGIGVGAYLVGDASGQKKKQRDHAEVTTLSMVGTVALMIGLLAAIYTGM